MAGFFQKFAQLIVGTEPLRPAPSTPTLATSYQNATPAHTPQQCPPRHATAPKKRSRKPLTERELIQRESEIGARIFGEPPKGGRREFFNLDQSTWIWYEESVDDATHQRTATTIRYEIHEQGILKVQEGARYNFIEGDELANFLRATQLYHQQVAAQIYDAPLMPVGVQD